TTDREGRFAFESSALERTILVATPRNRLEHAPPAADDERDLLSAVVEIAVEPGADRLVPDVVLKRGVTIRGTVHDPEGRPVAGAKVAAMPFVDWSVLKAGSP